MRGAEKPTTILVFADQLDQTRGPLSQVRPGVDEVLMIEATDLLEGRAWHRQRRHLLITALRRLGRALEEQGVAVDYHRAPSFAAGIDKHLSMRPGRQIIATSPSTHRGRALLASIGVTIAPETRFLTDPSVLEELGWGTRRVTMEDFYRAQRRRLGYLMDGDEPATGRWNYDAENRQPLPRQGVEFPTPVQDDLDDLDAEVIGELPPSAPGADPVGWWPTSRAGALRRLRHAIDEVLPRFGPYEDAMSSTNWHLAHTMLSPALNLGLLHPAEVADEIDAAWRAGRVDIASAEGLLRQIIGWREYVWCCYWLEGPDYLGRNGLEAHAPLPPAFTGTPTEMACLGHVLADVDARAWTHHIPRLMVLGNLCLLAGVEPAEVVDWMWERFVDGAEWVMVPNLIGMALHADGGLMATKPYAAGGNYISKMSDFCKGCRFDPKKRTGESACPMTTLYWDFLARHQGRFAGNHRMARQIASARQLSDIEEVRTRATDVLKRLQAGTL